MALSSVSKNCWLRPRSKSDDCFTPHITVILVLDISILFLNDADTAGIYLDSSPVVGTKRRGCLKYTPTTSAYLLTLTVLPQPLRNNHFKTFIVSSCLIRGEYLYRNRKRKTIYLQANKISCSSTLASGSSPECPYFTRYDHRFCQSTKVN